MCPHILITLYHKGSNSDLDVDNWMPETSFQVHLCCIDALVPYATWPSNPKEPPLNHISESAYKKEEKLIEVRDGKPIPCASVHGQHVVEE